MRFWSSVALLGWVAAQPALAQPAPPPEASAPLPAAQAPQPPAAVAEQPPPSRVGTVSAVVGTLAFHAPSDTQWSAAGVNYPVATGGSFWTEPQTRAQLQIGPTTLSMDGETELDVTNLSDEVAQLGLPQGRLHIHLRELDRGQSFEIDLPQGAVWLLRPGSYDIDAGNSNRGARIAVFAGSARLAGSGADVAISSGEAVVLSQSDPVTVTTERAGSDAFVEWCTAHDYRDTSSAATHYVSPHMTGYADLDRYGSWQPSPEYGQVWYPSQVPVDWAPYREGRWIWVAPWGWTWVDQEPWGFAPFHYGRWAHLGDRWGWVPGTYVAEPVYAPALVAFIGLGAGIGIAAATGPAVGWFPLAPGEAYWPSYTRNPNYIRNVNITNVKNINTIIVESRGGAPPPQVVNANFANRTFATVVPQRVFASSDPVAPAAVHITPAVLQKAPVAIRPPPVTPVPAKTPVAPPPRGLPNAAALGSNRVAPNPSPAQGEAPHLGLAHPGAAAAAPGGQGNAPAAAHPGAPAAAAGATRLPPPHPGEIAPAAPNRAAVAAPGGQGNAPAAAHPGAPAAAAVTRLPPPPPEAAAEHRPAPDTQNLRVPEAERPFRSAPVAGPASPPAAAHTAAAVRPPPVAVHPAPPPVVAHPVAVRSPPPAAAHAAAKPGAQEKEKPVGSK